MVFLAWEKWKHTHTHSHWDTHKKEMPQKKTSKPSKTSLNNMVFGLLPDVYISTPTNSSSPYPLTPHLFSINFLYIVCSWLCSCSCLSLSFPQSPPQPRNSSSQLWTKHLWSWSGPPLAGWEDEVTRATAWSVSSAKQGVKQAATVRLVVKSSPGIIASPSSRVSTLASGCSRTKGLWELRCSRGEVYSRADQHLGITQDLAPALALPPALSCVCPVDPMCSSPPARPVWRPPGWWWASWGPTRTTPSSSTRVMGSPRPAVQGQPRACLSLSPPTKLVRREKCLCDKHVYQIVDCCSKTKSAYSCCL